MNILYRWIMYKCMYTISRNYEHIIYTSAMDNKVHKKYFSVQMDDSGFWMNRQ